VLMHWLTFMIGYSTQGARCSRLINRCWKAAVPRSGQKPGAGTWTGVSHLPNGNHRGAIVGDQMVPSSEQPPCS
jgi:hypothetical protein